MCAKCHIRLLEFVLLQGGNKNTKHITPFLCRNNFVPVIEAIFCRSIMKRYFMGTYLSPDTKKNLKQFLYNISEYFLDILKAAFLGRIFRKFFNT